MVNLEMPGKFNVASLVVFKINDQGKILFQNANAQQLLNSSENVFAFLTTFKRAVDLPHYFISEVCLTDQNPMPIAWVTEKLENTEYLLLGSTFSPESSISKEIFQNIFNSIPLPIFWKDKNSRIVGCNQIYAANAGFEYVSSIIGKTDYELPWKDFASKYIKDDQEVIKNKTALSYEEENVDHDGSLKHVLVKKSPLFNADNDVVGLIGTYIDITDKKRADQFKTEKEEAEKKAKYMNMAAGTIAHDLRTPLATINLTLSFVENVLPELLTTYQWAYSNGYPGQQMGKDYIEGISSAVDNCRREVAFSNHYIDMILGNLKHDSIDTSNYQTHNIIKVIDYALATYPYREGQKELLHWQPTVDFDFWGHDYYIKNIINNLLKNSYYFISKADRGEIYLTTAENKTHYLLLVKDTAEGAAPEILSHIFDGYFSKRHGGTGLGLAFCKAIMRSFEGDVAVESVQGEFIEFTLHFPKQI